MSCNLETRQEVRKQNGIKYWETKLSELSQFKLQTKIADLVILGAGSYGPPRSRFRNRINRSTPKRKDRPYCARRNRLPKANVEHYPSTPIIMHE
jgi:hypothetical protein